MVMKSSDLQSTPRFQKKQRGAPARLESRAALPSFYVFKLVADGRGAEVAGSSLEGTREVLW